VARQMAAEDTPIYLTCFKCGRVVRSTDSACARCGMVFTAGTLFECPFCSGLLWRDVGRCTTCGVDLREFSDQVARRSERLDVDGFTEELLADELETVRSVNRRVACPECGFMLSGDEAACPRCGQALVGAMAACPVCGERVELGALRCPSCDADFGELMEPLAAMEHEESERRRGPGRVRRLVAPAKERARPKAKAKAERRGLGKRVFRRKKKD